jgi:hypothetical protein
MVYFAALVILVFGIVIGFPIGQWWQAHCDLKLGFRKRL